MRTEKLHKPWKEEAKRITRQTKGHYQHVDEWIDHAERLAKANGGKLPNPQEIINSDLFALYQSMRRNKDRFAHIKQERKQKRR